MKDYAELTVITTHDGAELVADILSEFTDGGVFIADAEDVIDLERKGKTWDYAEDGIYSAAPVTVKAFVKLEEKEKKIANIKDALFSLKKNSPFELGLLSLSVAEVDGDLWREKWKENFKPIHIGKVVVVPEWIDYTLSAGEIDVRLDSNMAFGTGEHETTAMCVGLLQKYVKSGMTVIDVGCGSGILGIVAAKLGAKKVIMTDIDECAVTASRYNLNLNGVKNAQVMLKNLLDDNSVKGDLIVANIMAEVLIGFASGIKNNLKSGGTIILSGILTDRLNKVVSAYLAQGFTAVETVEAGEWAAAVFKAETL